MRLTSFMMTFALLALPACPAGPRGNAGPGPVEGGGPGRFGLSEGMGRGEFTIRGMQACRLAGGDDSSRVYLYVLRMEDPGIGSGLFLMALYEGDDWIFIPRGETLTLSIDGRRIGLSGDGSMDFRKVTDTDLAREAAYYRISPADLQAIADAREVTVNLHGLERRFSEENLNAFREFVRQYLSGSSPKK